MISVRSCVRVAPLLGLLAASCSTVENDENLGTVQSPVVYGSDNRTDVYAHDDDTLVQRAEQSTVALVQPAAIDASDPQNIRFNAPLLGDRLNLCTTERFRSDPTPAFCSGTLIDDDLVLTAGHCITSASSCSNTRFVFNFYRTGAGALHSITSADVFSCTSIVARQQGTVGGRNLDYAVVRIDRAATPRFTPAPVRSSDQALASGTGVAVIGSGSGIPFKIDDGGAVRDPRSATLDYFVANTDTFGGNSGSGVYELEDYTVAGILVRGETDYRSNGSCNVVNVCTEAGCRGEDITYVQPAIEGYCAVAESERLCGDDGPPPGDSYSYSASNTNSARRNTVNHTITLAAGQRVTLGTCGVTGASFSGDTWLRVYGPTGGQVASNDDACGGRGSNLTFTASRAGSYEIRGGCYSNGSCSGTAAWTVQ